MKKKTRDAVAAATARLPRLRGQGVLIPGGKILTAAHCVGWTAEGDMVLGEPFIEPVRFGPREFKLTPFAVESVCDVAVLGALDDQTFCRECEQWAEFCESAVPCQDATTHSGR